MIVGGWNFVIAAYAVAGVALAVLASVVIARARRWAKRVAALDAVKAP